MKQYLLDRQHPRVCIYQEPLTNQDWKGQDHPNSRFLL